MQTLLLVILFFLVFSFIVSGFGAFCMFGDLVQFEHDRHREQWERDGRPSGFFHRPDTGQNLLMKNDPLRMFHCGVLWLAWLIRTPDWMTGDSEALRAHWWLRACTLYWNCGLLAGLFGAAWIANNHISN